MEASQTQALDRKALQLAIKDINTVLEPKPKLNFIDTIENLGAKIVKSVAAVIGEDDEGNPKWLDERASNLTPETLAVYEQLVTQHAQAPVPTPEEKPELFTKEGEECLGWEQGLGPKEGDEACRACSRATECTELAKPKAEAKPKDKAKSKDKAEPKVKEVVYGRVNSVVDCLLTGNSFSREELAKAANALYTEKGGKDNIKESAWAVNTFVKPLLLMGAVVESEGKFKKV